MRLLWNVYKSHEHAVSDLRWFARHRGPDGVLGLSWQGDAPAKRLEKAGLAEGARFSGMWLSQEGARVLFETGVFGLGKNLSVSCRKAFLRWALEGVEPNDANVRKMVKAGLAVQEHYDDARGERRWRWEITNEGWRAVSPRHEAAVRLGGLSRVRHG